MAVGGCELTVKLFTKYRLQNLTGCDFPCDRQPNTFKWIINRPAFPKIHIQLEDVISI